MMKKILPIFIIVLIIVGSGAFYGGIKYGQSKSSAKFQDAGGGLANLSSEERQQRFQQMGGARRAAGGPSGANFVNGEIISKDDKNLTIKLRDGGSKIVFFATSTPIIKSVEGLTDDLQVGDELMINGQANQDGSITAQSIQINPQLKNQ